MLNRFAFGPRPGQVEEVARQGLETWMEQQLRGNLQSPQLDRLLMQIPEQSDGLRLSQRKLVRAVYSPNQVHEVLSDFWFNHFNVSLTADRCRPHVAAYEREAIQPQALGQFRALLESTAHHPAMLYYLDNALSTADQAVAEEPMEMGSDPMGYSARSRFEKPRTGKARPKQGGLNENYARELLELHTLGVDGGYRQDDVREVARAFTGWTVQSADKVSRFVFRPESHDKQAKRVLYTTIAGGAEDEGEKILDILAAHPSTARFISKKFVVRFVSDHPPAALVEQVRKAFLRSRGDTREMVWAILEAPEFWSEGVRRSKVKTPFELQASALRILDAQLQPTSSVVHQLAQMGQECYSCRPPTGYPDRADYWISPGNMLMRMAFALELGTGRSPGVKVDLKKLKPEKPAATPQKALQAYAELILPGRDLHSTEDLLMQAVLDPDYVQKVTEARKSRGKMPKPNPKGKVEMNDQLVTKLVGLLLGCPEFQRR